MFDLDGRVALVTGAAPADGRHEERPLTQHDPFFRRADSQVAGPPRELVGYGEHPPMIRWRGDAKVAIQLVVNYEEGSEKTCGGSTSPGSSLSSIRQCRHSGRAPSGGRRIWNPALPPDLPPSSAWPANSHRADRSEAGGSGTADLDKV